MVALHGLSIARLQFFRETASTVSSNGLVLLLAQIMGMYFLSSVLLMRMNLPEEYRYTRTAVRARKPEQCADRLPDSRTSLGVLP